MSRNVDRLTPTQSIAPLIDITEGKSFVVHKGAKTIRYYVLPATSGSGKAYIDGGTGNNGTTTFNLFFPSKDTIIDRNVYLRTKVTHVLKTNNTSNVVLLRDGQDASNSFPVTNMIKTCTVDFDNNGVQLNVNKVHKHLVHYYYDQEDLYKSSSLTPSLLDNSLYFNQVGSNNNVLAFNKDTSYDSVPPRGAFPIQSLTGGLVGATANTYTLTQTYVETLPMSPLLLKSGIFDEEGLTNISNLKISITWESGKTSFEKAFCHNIITYTTNTFNGSTINPITLTIQNTANNDQRVVLDDYYSNIDSVELIIGMVSVQDTMIVPPIVNYEYTQLSYIENIASAVPPNTNASTVSGTSISSSNIQLSQIPHWVQFQVNLPENSTYNIGAVDQAGAAYPVPAYSVPNAYFCINGIDLTIGNQSGILATATPQQLYNMNVKNGLSFKTYADSCYNGVFIKAYPTINATPAYVPPTYDLPSGSPLRLRIGEDIQLNDPLMAPGLSMNLNFQATLKVVNSYKVNVSPTITIIFGYEGVATFDRARGVFFNTSVLTKEDVLDTTKEVDWADVQPDSFGGSFLGKLKKLAKRTGRQVSHLAQAAPGYVQKGIDLAERAAPYAERAAEVAAMSGLGYGKGGCAGAALVGGKTLSRKQMAKRLAY